ncbi:SUMF1/EgtB/PvdO family nonheme iron enzyme [Alcaligenes sp. SORT26]|uniref:formylglycine-generating enzyme family protein n=1 Tax=Alcaligenes sp. SORT26 TaxID=2813780 RepID=UPI001A9F55A1|nr:SUMF1/EgtB/PvdO family nonheme iron enzyme [Alcaligenes sp. SORT26]QTC00633.1 SUMF1/EgtB/PvdO family nonheme iron enzyme [Alcaligenes sp. SORT26]
MRHTPVRISATLIVASVLLLLVLRSLSTSPDPGPELIQVEGGSFMAGNFQVPMRAPDGEQSVQWVAQPDQAALAPYPVEVNAFSIMKKEASNALYDRFLKQSKRPARWQPVKGDGEQPANMPYDEAEAFCVWLGEHSSLDMRLPTEAEWEYAARSRGQPLPWATDNGQWQAGRNLPTQSSEADKNNTGAFPPNPLGIQDMASGLHEWVISDPARDPAHIRIFKGGSDEANSSRNTIPTRGIVFPLSEASIEAKPELARLRGRPAGTVYVQNATARCVAPLKSNGTPPLPTAPNTILPPVFDDVVDKPQVQGATSQG